MTNWQRWLFVLFTCILGLQEIRAEDETGTEGDNKEEKEGTIPRALRMEIANGIIDFVNNARRAQIDLEWDLLPVDDALQKNVKLNNITPITFTISNDALGDATKLAQSIPLAIKNKLEDAFKLPVSDNTAFWAQFIASGSPGFEQYWVTMPGQGRSLVVNKSINTEQYFNTLRDHNQIKHLLQGNGITYSLTVERAEVRDAQQLPTRSNTGIVWEIKIYPFLVSTSAVTYYRFTAKARMPRQELYFPKTEAEKATLKAEIHIAAGGSTVGILNKDIGISSGIEIELSKLKDDEIKKLEDENANTQVQKVLSFVSNDGIQLGDVITRGLLGGTENISYITGALLDSTLNQFVGINLEAYKDQHVTAGFALGIVPNDSYSLFGGISFQVGAITLGVGGRLLEREMDEDKDGTPEKKLGLKPSGLISIDLSRITNSKKTRKRIELQNATSGGNWGKASEQISQDLTLLEITFVKGDNLRNDDDKGFMLKRIKMKDGQDATGSQIAAFNFLLNANHQKTLKFIPRGIYQYDIPDGFYLESLDPSGFIGPAPIPDDHTVAFVENQARTTSWQLSRIGQIESIESGDAKIGTTVTIKGKFFGPGTNGNDQLVAKTQNGSEIPITTSHWSDEEIKFVIPNNLSIPSGQTQASYPLVVKAYGKPSKPHAFVVKK